ELQIPACYAEASNYYSAWKDDMMKKFLIAAVILIVISIPVVVAQEDEFVSRRVKRIPFENVGSVAVLIESLDDDGRKCGISEYEFKALVELKLRQSGIGVREMNDYTLESPYIYININMVYLEKIDHFTYSMNMGLMQTVRLLRNEQTLTAQTWDKGLIAIHSSETIRTSLKEGLDSLLTFFINDYLSANPRNGK
ncbi:MAG TPA: hypothetical protein PLZ55_09660, partial [bacterium]|nr:hypothetical protein [bacterium]